MPRVSKKSARTYYWLTTTGAGWYHGPFNSRRKAGHVVRQALNVQLGVQQGCSYQVHCVLVDCNADQDQFERPKVVSATIADIRDREMFRRTNQVMLAYAR